MSSNEEKPQQNVTINQYRYVLFFISLVIFVAIVPTLITICWKHSLPKMIGTSADGVVSDSPFVSEIGWTNALALLGLIILLFR